MDLRKTNYLLIIINVILIILVVLLMLYSLSFNTGYSKTLKQSSPDIDSELISSDQEKGNLSFEYYQNQHDKLNDIIANLDLESCNLLDVEFQTLCVDNILINLVFQNNNFELCRKIESPEIQRNCQSLSLINQDQSKEQ